MLGTGAKLKRESDYVVGQIVTFMVHGWGAPFSLVGEITEYTEPWYFIKCLSGARYRVRANENKELHAGRTGMKK